jgi:tRNA 2-selenouridine synthase SelU
VLRQAIEALPEQRDLKIGLVEFLTQRRGRDAAAKELDAMIAANPKDYSLKLAQAAFLRASEGVCAGRGGLRQPDLRRRIRMPPRSPRGTDWRR